MSGSPPTKTVVELDLVNFSKSALIIQEQLDVKMLEKFCKQIQAFVDIGLRAVGASRQQSVKSTAGDNAILVFDTAENAHCFAVAVHKATQKHNATIKHIDAKRWFRIGVATGELSVKGKRIYGKIIVDAVRLETAGKAGHILIDPATYRALPEELQPAYHESESITDKNGVAYDCYRSVVVNIPRSESRDDPEASDDSIFAKCGLASAFRIPKQDPSRQKRVREIVKKEVRSNSPHFRLLASSGFSYVHPNGWVWRNGLANALHSHEARLEFVVQSPFSDSALARAIACRVDHHHWQEKVSDDDLLRLLEIPRIDVRVTDYPVYCSLFFSKTSVLYDPYLLALPYDGGRVENNFWVFQFSPKQKTEYDCYNILERHFQFHFKHSVPLSTFLGTDGNKYRERTDQFRERVRKIRESEKL